MVICGLVLLLCNVCPPGHDGLTSGCDSVTLFISAVFGINFFTLGRDGRIGRFLRSVTYFTIGSDCGIGGSN